MYCPVCMTAARLENISWAYATLWGIKKPLSQREVLEEAGRLGFGFVGVGP